MCEFWNTNIKCFFLNKINAVANNFDSKVFCYKVNNLQNVFEPKANEIQLEIYQSVSGVVNIDISKV